VVESEAVFSNATNLESSKVAEAQAFARGNPFRNYSIHKARPFSQVEISIFLFELFSPIKKINNILILI